MIKQVLLMSTDAEKCNHLNVWLKEAINKDTVLVISIKTCSKSLEFKTADFQFKRLF